MTESGLATLKAPVPWNVVHGVVSGYVPVIEPPCQQSGPVPVIDTGQSSTWSHDAVRASTAVAVVSSGL